MCDRNKTMKRDGGKKGSRGEREGRLTRPSSGVRLDALELAHLALDPAIERDVREECDEREERCEERCDRRREPRARVRQAGQPKRDYRHRCRCSYVSHFSTWEGMRGRVRTNRVDGEAAGPGSANGDGAGAVGVVEGGGVPAVVGVANAVAVLLVPACCPVFRTSGVQSSEGLG